MSRSKARLAADWFAKLRLNAQNEVEHADVATVGAEVVAVSDSVSTTVSSQLTSVAGDVATVSADVTAVADSVTAVSADVASLSGTVTSKLDASTYTAADVLAKVKTVDGAGSGLDADTLDGNHASAFALASHSHDYVPERNRSDWNDGTVIGDVIGQMAWKNYGNGHTIFDASQSTSPDGTAVNNTNPDYGWTATYPTLMGWNGANTYGVRVDSARFADYLGGSPASSFVTTHWLGLAGNGYIRLSNGLTLMWGEQYVSNGANAYTAFPATFPSACLRVFATINSASGIPGNKSDYCFANSWNTSYTYLKIGSDYAYNVQWLAIGY